MRGLPRPSKLKNITMQTYEISHQEKSPKNENLDKLAQLSLFDEKKTIQHRNVTSLNKKGRRPDQKKENDQEPLSGKKTLLKRARAKYVTNGLTNKLRKIESPLNKSYLNSYYCASILKQEGQKITGVYCNNRWCLVCNRIRTAKMITGYKEVLEGLRKLQFVTLTIPNVPGEKLRNSIQEMIQKFRIIQKKFHNRDRHKICYDRGGQDLKEVLRGIRKLEVTYNPIRDDFHPHFHFLIQGSQESLALVSAWLLQFPEANLKAQDITPADKGSILELFKYFSKIISDGGVIHAGPLDIIFQAMRNMRVVQPLGIKKNVSEDVDEVRAEIYRDIQEAESTWSWIDDSTDWVDKETGEILTGYVPTEKLRKIFTCK